MSNVKWIAGRRGGIAVGVALSFAAGGLYLTGLLDGLSRRGLDLHFRTCGDIPADPSIVLIDIDDQSLAALRWPWPRRLYADLVRSLNELDASAIVLDVILAEPTAPRVEHAGLGRDYDLDTGLLELGDRASDQPIFDDDELRDALSLTHVYLPMYAQLGPPSADPGGVADRAIDLVRRDPAIDLAVFDKALDVPAFMPVERLFIQARIAARLETDFGLDEAAIVAVWRVESGEPRKLVRENLAAAKRMAAERAARNYVRDHPSPTWPGFFASMVPGGRGDAVSADRECLINAFRAERSRGFVANSAEKVPTPLDGRIQGTHDPVYPLDKFAEAASGIGFVAFGRDETDGVVRSAPLVVDVDRTLVPQLGLKVALRQLGASQPSIGYRSGALTVTTADSELRIPIDRNGRTLINWYVPKATAGLRDWRDSFVHIPAARPLEISLNRRAISDNERRLALAKADLLKARHAETHAEYARYVDLVRRRDELTHPSGRAAMGKDVEPISRELVGVEHQIREMETDAIVWLKRAKTLWRNVAPQGEDEIADRGRIHRLYEWLNEGALASRIAESNRRLQARNAELRKELSAQIGGKVCLVGYTASGVADLITTPIHSQAPGVIAHANIINMVLQNRFVSEASPVWNVAIVMLAGLTATVAGCAGGWRFSLAGLLVTGAAFVAAGMAAFRLGSIHIASFPAAAAVAGVWAGVTLYRQSTEERARRRLHRALMQYTSPAIAARITDRFDRAALAPQAALVTCFFSDLRGFTQLSERLGPERTRDVLNPYLETVSRVLLERGAMVNKFVGDGIFAFFNSPILACPDHARSACEAALASHDALRGLERIDAPDLGGEALAMRVGISTGEAFVGDYGSEMKLDYTCIGDTVNLGSRLEQANKSLGTSILVDERTRDALADGFAVRPIGRIAVVGRSAPACVYELVGREQMMDSGFVEFCGLLTRAIGHYQACEWDLCRSTLAECRALRPDDRVVALYARSVETLRRVGSASDWDGAIRIGASDA